MLIKKSNGLKILVPGLFPEFLHLTFQTDNVFNWYNKCNPGTRFVKFTCRMNGFEQLIQNMCLDKKNNDVGLVDDAEAKKRFRLVDAGPPCRDNRGPGSAGFFRRIYDLIRDMGFDEGHNNLELHGALGFDLRTRHCTIWA